MEEFPCLVHKLSVILTTVGYKPQYLRGLMFKLIKKIWTVSILGGHLITYIHLNLIELHFLHKRTFLQHYASLPMHEKLGHLFLAVFLLIEQIIGK